ncbi:MAG: tryptophan synthase subunit alpha [Verrucomicrobiaceae bacterium]|nr:tryptophan synthase subunit alpha [Verrucomicrobiaceae bacterium]
MNNRIEQLFDKLRSEGKCAFVAYVCAGDPDADRCIGILNALDRAGVDLIEIGVPFSDPLADGVVNQMAASRALSSGASVENTLEIIRNFRKSSNTPIVLFTYLNPIYTYGFKSFYKDASCAGADGILNLDLPPDEESHNEELREGGQLLNIRIIAPNTPVERITDITSSGEGFIYYISREGVTGERSELAEGIGNQVDEIKKHTSLPVVVGFGISTPEHSSEIAKVADGVVVGSAIVKTIEKHSESGDLFDRVYQFVKPLVDASKSV